MHCKTLSVVVLQLMSQYPSLYSPAHSESGKWDALVKASESLLKEKELIIERQVFFNNFTACVGVIIAFALFDNSKSYLILFYNVSHSIGYLVLLMIDVPYVDVDKSSTWLSWSSV